MLLAELHLYFLSWWQHWGLSECMYIVSTTFLSCLISFSKFDILVFWFTIISSLSDLVLTHFDDFLFNLLVSTWLCTIVALSSSLTSRGLNFSFVYYGNRRRVICWITILHKLVICVMYYCFQAGFFNCGFIGFKFICMLFRCFLEFYAASVHI